ncbi:MAG: phage virion morphogenesis protein [Bryobacterales bacterium]|nr:phage virion morphogenesis protein [Bryobacterales bacterium]
MDALGGAYSPPRRLSDPDPAYRRSSAIVAAMPADIKIEYDDREVVAALNRLARSGQDLTPAMREIADTLEDAAEEAFEREQSPDGKPWADLSEHTKARCTKKKKWPRQILQVQGRLAGSITSRYDSQSAEAGSNLAYAATHQFGAVEGEIGSTRHGRPIPWGDIPARAFLGRSEDVDAQILDVIQRHCEDALRRP